MENESTTLSLDLRTNIQAGLVDSNLQAIKEEVQQKMVVFKEKKVTLENLAESKKDLANLRKLKAAMKDNKEGSIKQYNMPMENFIKLFDDVYNIVTEAENVLDKQVKLIAQQELENILAERKDLFSDYIGKEDPEIQEYLMQCKNWLIPKEWNKKTVSNKAIVEYITTTITNVKTAYAAFKDHMYAKELLKEFATTGDFNATFSIMQAKEQEYNRILEIQQAAKEKAEAEAEAKQLEKERRKAEEEERKARWEAEKAAKLAQPMPTSEEIHAQQQQALNNIRSQNGTYTRENIVETEDHAIKIPKEEMEHGVLKITPPAITVPTDEKSLTLCRIDTCFEGDRWKIQALLDYAKLIHLKRIPKGKKVK